MQTGCCYLCPVLYTLTNFSSTTSDDNNGAFYIYTCKVDKLMKSFVPQYEFLYVGSGIAYRQSHMKMVNSS